MATYKIVLFYGFTPLAAPESVRLWQQALGERWGLTGRVVVSRHGINATLGGTVENLKQYVRTTRQHPGLEHIDVKWSDGTGADFPRLSVKVRPELVSFGVPDEVEVDERGVVGGGVPLGPDEVDALVAERDDVVFFDGRNAFEAEIGRFKGAVVPDVRTTRDFIEQIDSGTFDHLKDRPIVTYCTGGVRCEVLSALMRKRGFEEVYQVAGGIVRYAEARGADGLWEGSLYVFDERRHVEFADGVEPLGSCVVCSAPAARYENCGDASCRTLRLACAECTPAVTAGRCEACVAERPGSFVPRPTARPGVPAAV
ncbi:rhodanese-related sulfurtransferase [Sanguibacter hominis ATCC BAA-789]|uniref:tRNA uridine(34) hydroxylase n=1 Tax=Sanguibacter hominis ATCC BAA-789 TaxID=1312740 RepID=A0A9X5FDF1_9MICO|nr:rhodanese-related sulfurtransferase [Sanguibacter hominis]NKX92204.1 rhodanese-related sulfurtransferase [Sanguibacter hominis ATCC BAA-789]